MMQITTTTAKMITATNPPIAPPTAGPTILGSTAGTVSRE